MKTLRTLALFLTSAIALPTFAADQPTPAEVAAKGMPPTIAPGAQVVLLSDAGEGSFTEGTTCAANGDVYFTDQNHNRIYKWDVTAKKVSVFLEPSGRANGQYFDAKGNLVACADEMDQLWSIAPDGTHTVLVANFNGKYMNGPNDVWIRPDGGMYLTDPFYLRAWWDHKLQPQPACDVYYLTPDHTALWLVAKDFAKPNGIVGTPDGKTLYVSDIDGGRTWGYDIQPEGTLTQKRLVCNFGSDGMSIDEQGNLYLTVPGANNGVTVVDSKTGQEIGYIPVPQHPANLAFGGKDKKTLYICAGTGFYSIDMNVKGLNQSK